MGNIYDTLTQKILVFTAPRLNYEPGSEDYETLEYGIATLIYTIVRSVIIIAIGAIAGILPEIFFVLVGFAFNGKYSFGLHFEHTWQCTLHAIITYIGGAFLGIYLPINPIVRLVLFALCAIIFVMYSPAETKKRPIPENQRKGFKKKSLISIGITGILILALSILGYEMQANLIIIGLIMRSLMLTPLMFRIFEP